jgi:hypothetical protein
MANEQTGYFSVRFTTKMMGARFIPAVCYKLDDQLRPAVEKLAEQGEARLYPEEVRFVSGSPVPVKKSAAPGPVLSSVSAVPAAPLDQVLKGGPRRGGNTAQSRREFS